MDFAVLGPLRVTRGDEAVDIGGPRQRRLLAALIANADDVVSTDRLIEIVFEQDPPRGAANTIRTYVARLRKSLSEASPDAIESIVTRPPGYGFSSNGHRVDTAEFAERVQIGGDLLGSDPVDAVGALERALDVWRGQPFEEFIYEDWARPEIDRLEELHLAAQENLVEARLACGLHEEVIPDLRQLVAEHPLRERPWRLLALALYRSGRQAEALRASEELRVHLGEVGLEPSGTLVALERSVAAHDPALHLTQPAGRPLRGYHLGQLIGEGAHGVVYQGIQPGIGREVAVKAIKSDLVDRPDFIRRFDVEAQLVARLEHPHIVPLYDYWREPGGAYMVMRRLDHNLADELSGGPFDTPQVADLARQLGSALASAHQAKVVHGDLKPTNILLDAGGNAYLSDFGVATLLDQPDDAALSPTSGYEAPEVLDGQSPRPAGDQFALGVLLAQTLTGTLPFGTRGIAGPNDRIRSIHAARPAVPAAVDDALDRATAWEPADRYPDIPSFVEGFTSAIEGRSEPSAVKAPATPNPYRGLRPFEEADARFFFGRDRLTAEVIGRLSLDDVGCRFVTLIGASGGGKSSIVRAGVVPELRRGAIPGSEDWLIATMVPGPDPFASLVAGLLPIAGREPTIPTEGGREGWFGEILRGAIPAERSVLLVLDQMEELFTLADPAARSVFLAGLTDTLDGHPVDLRVLATLRADFYDRPLQTPILGELVKQGGVTVVGMTAAELNEAIVEPAGRARVEVEPALATQLVSEVVNQPAALPLLQFTLRELYEKRSSLILDLASYEDEGGMEAAITGHAETVYGSLPERDQAKVEPVFLKLITVSEDGAPTRRRVPVGELGAETADVVDAFAAARLLTLDADPATREPTAELSHEALISHWPRLRGWVSDAGEDLVTRAKLTEASSEWESRGRNDSDLYRGARLESALAWAARHPDELGDIESAYLAAGEQLRDAEIEARKAQLNKERRGNRRLRRLLVGLGALLLIALAAGFFAVTQRNQAREEEARATIQALVAASSATVEQDAQLSLLLATEALGFAIDNGFDFPAAEQAVHDALAVNREVFNVPNTDNGLAHFSPDGKKLIASTHPDDPSILQVWSVDSREVLLDLRGHEEPLLDAVFSPDGSLIASTAGDDTVRVWDSTTGAEVYVLEVTGVNPSIPVFSNDGTLIAANTFEGEAWIWEVETGKLLHRLQSPDPSEVGPAVVGLNLAFSPDDTLLALALEGESSPNVLIWDLATGERHGSFDGGPSPVTVDVAFTPDGRILIAGGEGGIVLWDVSTGEQAGSLTDDEVSFVRDIQVSADGTALAAGGIGDTLIWDLGNREVHDRVRGHTGRVDGIDLSPDGTLLMTGSAWDGTTRLWNLDPESGSRLVSVQRSPDPPIFASGAVYSPDGAHVAATKSPSSVALWDAASGAEVGEFETDVVGGVNLDYSADGALLAVGGWEGAMIRDLERAVSTVLFRDDPAMQAPVGVSFHPESRFLATASSRGLEVWPVDGQDEPELLYPFPVWGARYSSDGSMLAAASEGSDQADNVSFVVVYDTASGEQLVSIPTGFNQDTPHIGDVITMAFSSDGTKLVTVSWDGSAAVWDTENWEPITELTGHTELVASVAIDPEDVHVATVGFDATLNISDLETGSLLLNLTGDDVLTGVDYSPDGAFLVVASDTGPIWIQPVAPNQILELARDGSTREFTPEECVQYAIPDCPQVEAHEE